MTKQERIDIENKFEEFVDLSLKLKLFHNYETGEVIMIVFNPNILGITHLKDFLTLKADHLRNLVFWFRTRDPNRLEIMLKIWRKVKYNENEFHYPLPSTQPQTQNIVVGGLKPEILPLQPTV